MDEWGSRPLPLVAVAVSESGLRALWIPADAIQHELAAALQPHQALQPQQRACAPWILADAVRRGLAAAAAMGGTGPLAPETAGAAAAPGASAQTFPASPGFAATHDAPAAHGVAAAVNVAAASAASAGRDAAVIVGAEEHGGRALAVSAAVSAAAAAAARDVAVGADYLARRRALSVYLAEVLGVCVCSWRPRAFVCVCACKYAVHVL